ERRAAGDGEGEAERQARFREQRRRVGADAEKRRLRQRFLAGIADDEIDAERRHRGDQPEGEDVGVVAAEAERRGRQRRDAAQNQRERETAAHTVRSSRRPSKPCGRNRITSTSSAGGTAWRYDDDTPIRWL